MQLQSYLSLDTTLWIIGILGTVILSLIAVIYNNMNSRMKDLKVAQEGFQDEVWSEINRVKNTSNSIQTNYLQRFNEVNKNILEGNAAVLEKLNDFILAVSQGKIIPQK